MINGVRAVSPVGCLVAAFTIVSSSAFAQAQQQSGGGHEGFGVQVIGGPLFSNLTDATGLNTSAKTGWLVGLGLGGNRGGRIGVEADVLYGQKSTDVNHADFDQHIVHVPVMLKGNIGSSSRNGLSVFVLGGGFFDWQFNSKLAGVDISKNTDGYEVGFVVGGGAEFARVSVQGRYLQGVREIDRTFNLGASQDIKTQAFVILVGFRLN